MVAHSISLAPALRKPTPAAAHPQGFARGTTLRSVFGPRPVERLMAGDLLLDAAGQIIELRALRQVRARPGELVRLAPSECLPGLERALIVGAAQQLEMCDWRTQLLYGQSALTTAAQLVDGGAVRRLKTPRVLYHLGFDADSVVLANGLPARVSASAQVTQNHRHCVGQVF